MTYKGKAAVCSEIRTKHSTQSENHVEFLNNKPDGYVKKLLGFKWLRLPFIGVRLLVFWKVGIHRVGGTCCCHMQGRVLCYTLPSEMLGTNLPKYNTSSPRGR
jgi:hypothetical protein